MLKSSTIEIVIEGRCQIFTSLTNRRQILFVVWYYLQIDGFCSVLLRNADHLRNI